MKPVHRSITVLALAFVLALYFCGSGLQAQTNIFTTTPNSEYATPANWSLGTIPGNGNNNEPRIGNNNTASSIYNAATSYSTTSRLIVGIGSGNGTLTMTGAAGTLSFAGSPFNVANYIGVDGGTGLLTANAGTLNLTGMTSGGGHLHVGANSGTSNGTLTLGGGTVNVGTRLTLGVGYPGELINVVGNNGNGNGTITINSGTLNIGTGTGLDTDRGFLYMKSPTGGSGAATVNLNGGTLSLAKFQIGGGGTSKTINFNGGTVQARASDATFLTAGTTTIQLGGAKVDTNGFNITIGSLLAHDTGLGATLDGGLTKSGTGTLELTAANTYTGSTIVTGGTLNVASSGSLTNISALNTKSGGAMTISGTVTIGNGGSFGVGASVTGTTGSVTLNTGGVLNIGGGGGFTGIGGRDGTVPNTGGPYGNGTLTVAGGTLNVAAPGTGTSGLGGTDATNFWMNPYGTGGGTSTVNLDGGVISTHRTFTNGSGSLTVFNLNGGTLQAASGYTGGFFNGLSRVNVRNGGAVIDTNGNSLTVGAALLHSNVGGDAVVDGGLTKNGTGTLTLSAANTYTGPTTVSGGTLAFSGSGTTSTASAITVQNGGTLRFSRNDTWGSHTTDVSSAITVNAGGTMESGGFYNTLRDLTLNGGTVALTGGANATFPAFAFKGTVTVGGSQASQINTVSGSNNAINIGDDTLGATVFNVADSTGNANADLTINAVLQNNQLTNANSITKTGVGTMVLTAANTYTGTTTVNGGRLLVNGSIAGPGAVTVATGGTLGGSGTITTTGLTIQSGGTLAPGNSPQNLIVNGPVALSPGAIFGVEAAVNGFMTTGDGTNGTDLLTVNGTINVSGATLSGTWGGGPGNLFTGTVGPANMTWIVNNVPSDLITGTFANTTASPGLTSLFGTPAYFGNLGGQPVAVFYQSQWGVPGASGLSGGNDLLLIAIPEPSRSLFALLAMLPFVLRRRR